MKKTILTTVFILASFTGFGQVYNPGGTVTDSISAFTGDKIFIKDTLDLGNKKITNLGTPEEDDEAANKKYVDTEMQERVLQLNTIAELEAYEGAGTTVFVKDSLRGGIFNYEASGLTVDNGVVFNASDGGFWKRQFNPENGQNVLWYGVDPTGVLDNAAILEEVIAHQSYRTGKIYIPSGTYKIESMIGDVHGAEDYMISNDVKIFGDKGTKIVVDSPSEILAAIGFEMGTIPTDVTFENIEIHGNNKANRGVYFRHIRDLDPMEIGSRIVIDNVKVFDIFLGANFQSTQAQGITVYGKFEETTIKNCTINNIHTDQNRTIQGILVSGNNDPTYKLYNKKVNIFNNIIKNIFSYLPTDDEQDAIRISQGLTSNNSEYSAIIYNNTFINCRGRSIKVQSKNVLVESNTIIQEAEMQMFNDGSQGYIDIQYGDFRIIGNTFIFNNLDQIISGGIIAVKNYGTEETDRGIISNNKFECDYAIDRFIFLYEDAISSFLGNITIENNVVSTGVNRFLHYQSAKPSTEERVFTLRNNSVDSISDVFLYNFQERKINITAIGNINYGVPVNISNTYDSATLINNLGFIEPDTYIKSGGALSLSGYSEDTIINNNIDANELSTTFTYLDAGSPNVPVTPNGFFVLSGRLGGGAARFGAQLFMGTNDDKLFYRGQSDALGYNPTYQVASREWVNDSLENHIERIEALEDLSISVHEQTITATELQNIGTTAVELITAVPGIIVVERVVAKMEGQTTSYDFTNGLQITYDTFPEAIATFDNTFANSILDAYASIDGGSVPAHTNAGIFIESASNPTTGDGILHLKIYYRIVEF